MSDAPGSAENDAVTWRDVAVAFPEHVQQHVQKHGPLPDKPITPESWAAFCAGASPRPEATVEIEETHDHPSA